jgi:hypothetical protein
MVGKLRDRAHPVKEQAVEWTKADDGYIGHLLIANLAGLRLSPTAPRVRPTEAPDPTLQ